MRKNIIQHFVNLPLFQGINNDTEYQVITNRKMSVKECKQLNCEHARFGYALSRAGDINQDGFKGERSLSQQGVWA